MTESWTIVLKTLTPLWTGGVDGTCDRIHETGIIGSLRWWYEVIVRGLGGQACDPTEHLCGFDEKKFKKPKTDGPAEWRRALLQANVCDVCQAYGATGWARRYRLRLRGGKSVGFSSTLRITPGKRRRGWFLGAGLWGTLNGRVIAQPLFTPASLVVPLTLAEMRGGLGSRVQHGYGVVQTRVLKNQNPVYVSEDMLRDLPGGNKMNDQGMPSLRNMFFVTVTLKTMSADWWRDVEGLQRLGARDADKLIAWIETGSVPVSPVIRNQIRFEDGLGLRDTGQRNFIFGSSDRICKVCYQRVTGQGEAYRCPACGPLRKSQTLERTKAKIHVSAAWPLDDAQRNWQVRIWGWIPWTLPAGVAIDRECVLQRLYKSVGDETMWRDILGNRIAFVNMKWREFACLRDETTGQETEIVAFLHSLLVEEGNR